MGIVSLFSVKLSILTHLAWVNRSSNSYRAVPELDRLEVVLCNHPTPADSYAQVRAHGVKVRFEGGRNVKDFYSME